MSAKTSGGPAFSRPASERGDGLASPEQDGMSLRQWYAGMALQGNLANNEKCGSPAEYAADSFEMADAMIAHEEKLKGES